ncbi:MAG TPA: AGE family epimerase/isomerase [Pseudonocardiaceae bacterium]|jgi:mannose/cellobiose epimerase-like protein (N-acyl-D-glucosamine 2-epimerase family)|nr:AGE family epimerase/isomerase [Pseudonocardiaceae bacterium]
MAIPNHPAQVPNNLAYTWTDTIAGYVESFDAESRTFELKTSDKRSFTIEIDETTGAELLRNLGEPYTDGSGHLDDVLVPGRYVIAYGIFYPVGDGLRYTAKHIELLGRGANDYNFEEPTWWARQIDQLASFYRRAQFGTGAIDYRDYRTELHLGGSKTESHVQETDTISRMVYGMASAYMLTGKEDYLEVAEKGTEHLRDHMRFVDRGNDVIYWYHGVRIDGKTETKLFSSEFSDDYDAIPMYEQIYALAGPIQTFRVTGDPRIIADADGTMRLFEKFFRDYEQGGYYSHLDPILLSPHHDSLGANASRKNWNSVGDHAPAYLVNLYLATGEQRHLDMLERTFDTIVDHFPDYQNSPFVNERFMRDWSHDLEHTWQQNRAVVGHNLKIAWNLMRMHGQRPKKSYVELAEKIAKLMPSVGSDRQRGGWYDVVERVMRDGEQNHRFAWHDRKAWWQQEQAILAYLILYGSLGDNEYLRHAREAESFYNSFFLDHDEGGVYFNVLATGMPYLLGTERLKGSHSMSMYHSAELCYLSATYTNLLITKQPLQLWFKPHPDASRTLRVAPDLLPTGRVRLQEVEIDGKPYEVFDPRALTVTLPESADRLTVRATLVAADD